MTNFSELKSKFKALNPYQVIAINVAVILVIMVFYALYVPLKDGSVEKIEVKIKQGQGLHQIARILKENDLIRSRYVFIVYTMARGDENNLKAGNYSFTRGMNIPEIEGIIAGGFADSNDYQILLAEGFNVWEIDKRLAEYKMGNKTQFAKKYIESEGSFFPDTYRISRPNNENFDLNIISDAVAQKMIVTFDEKVRPLLASLSLDKQREVIIIASMLEKEARAQRDMELVAGIIYKRLELGMRLQIDATVAYGACLRQFEISQESENCDVTKVPVGKEIKIDSLYNTYTRHGLPFGPIANPGLKSIKAALNPKSSPYLFYLSTRDTGQIIYSRTGAEHEANRLKYLGL